MLYNHHSEVVVIGGGIIATDGCFSVGGTFTKGPIPEAKDLEELFR